MTGERWRRLRELFAEAIRLPRPARPAFVAASVGDDAALGEELSGLLAFHATTQETSTTGVDLPAPQRMGDYEIVRELGRGGMGVVYEARRDGELTRRVAIKLIRRGLDSRAVVARFRRERAILAQLEHPNITRLYDAGVSEDGQPYFVMEYVDGLPWREYVRHRPLREKVLLLASVCQAVEYAHQRLTVHQDLKPSNVMVTQTGEVKLLDFGAARLLDMAGDVTITGPRPFTPRYASPELRAGAPVSVTTDVYSLGVMLRDLTEGDRDLDAIAARATREEPDFRYASVAALRADLERHLRYEAVEARQGRSWYRARKFLRRHRGAALAAALAVVVGTAGLVATLRESARAEAERRRSEERLEALRAFSRRFVAGAGSLLAQDAQKQRAYEDLITQSAPYLQEVLLAQYPPDLLSSLDQLCGITQAARARTAVDQDCRGIFAEAVRRVNTVPASGEGVWLALAVSERWAAIRNDAEAVRWAEYGLSRGAPSLERVKLGLDLSNIEFRRDQWDRYVAQLRRSVGEWQSLPRSPAEEPGLLLRLAYLFTLGDVDSEARFILERMLARDRREPYALGTRLDLYAQLGQHARWRGRHAEAIEFTKKVVEWRALEPASVRQLSLLADARYRLADALRDAGRMAEAVAEYERAYQNAQQMLRLDPRSLEAPVGIAAARLKLAEGLFVARRLAEALPHAEAVSVHRMTVWRAKPGEGFLTRDAAYALGLEMRLRAELGQTAAAVERGELALKVLVRFVAGADASERHMKHAAEIHEYLAGLAPGDSDRHRAEVAALRSRLGPAVERRKRDLAVELAPLRPLIERIIG